MKEVYILSAVRTPIGSFGGMFSNLSAIELGIVAAKGAVERAGISPNAIEEVFMGNVCTANLGQAPARQVAIGAGLGLHVPCTTVNKVCASGMKSIMFAAQSIMLGHNQIALAGGMESMSNIPYYLPNARFGYKYGHAQMLDGLQRDGLTDVYAQQAMGVFADATASKYEISRQAQDDFAIASYKRAATATESGHFLAEIVGVSVPQRRGDNLLVTEDEEYKKVDFNKIGSLRAAFTKEGTVTAANASTINDGASALVLASGEKVAELGLKPLARIVSFADAAHEPAWFTTAPVKAAQLAFQRANIKASDVDFYEVNEAFAVVAMAFAKEFGIEHEQLNVFGGAVSLGHPLGASGARIVTTLNNVLHQKNGKLGCAAICNGGGGASAMIIEKI